MTKQEKSEYNKTYYAKHRQKIKQSKQKRYANDAEFRLKQIEQAKKWRHDNRHKYNAVARERYQRKKQAQEPEETNS